MSREEWDESNEYEMRYREDCGIFTEWPDPSDVVDARRDSRTPGGNKARKAAKGKTGAQ